jgi:hypothetical protein
VSPFSGSSPRQAGSTSPECLRSPRLPASIFGGCSWLRLPCHHGPLHPGVPFASALRPRLRLALRAVPSGLHGCPLRPSAPTHIDIPSSADLAVLDSGLPSTFGLRRPSELWFIPRIVVLSDPVQARPLACAFVLPRWARSSCDPVCHHHAWGKTPGQGVFFSSQGYPLRFPTIPRSILFIHR